MIEGYIYKNNYYYLVTANKKIYILPISVFNTMRTINQAYNVARRFIGQKVAGAILPLEIYFSKLAENMPLEQRLQPETMILPPNPDDPLYRANQRKAAYANLEAEMEAHDRIGAILACRT